MIGQKLVLLLQLQFRSEQQSGIKKCSRFAVSPRATKTLRAAHKLSATDCFTDCVTHCANAPRVQLRAASFSTARDAWLQLLSDFAGLFVVSTIVSKNGRGLSTSSVSHKQPHHAAEIRSD